MRVQKRSDGGEACHWKGNNLEEMKTTLPGIINGGGGMMLAVMTSGSGRNATAMVNDWVIKMNDGTIEIHRHDEFERIFYEAT
jgi:hypothetical protein